MFVRFFQLHYSCKAIISRLTQNSFGSNFHLNFHVHKNGVPMRITVAAAGPNLDGFDIVVPVALIHEFLTPHPFGVDIFEWRTVGGKRILGKKQNEDLWFVILPPHGEANEKLLFYILDEAVRQADD